MMFPELDGISPPQSAIAPHPQSDEDWRAAYWDEERSFMMTPKKTTDEKYVAGAFLSPVEDIEYERWLQLRSMTGDPLPRDYVDAEYPHLRVLDFGGNQKVVIENEGGKVQVKVYTGDTLPRFSTTFHLDGGDDGRGTDPG